MLNQPIQHRWNPQLANATSGLRNLLAENRLRTVAAAEQGGADLEPVCPQVSWKLFDGHPVNSRGTLVAANSPERAKHVGSLQRSLQQVRETNRSVFSPQPRPGFTLWRRQRQPKLLDRCSARARHEATSPLIPFGPSRLVPLLCPLLTSARRSKRIAPPSVQLLPDTLQISQGKTQNFPCVGARFIKHTPIAEGGLRCHVPTRPGCTTPHIWFLFVAPQF